MTSLRICFVGDSITAGTGDPDHLGWPGRLCARETSAGHDVTLYNLGIRGNTSAQIAERWACECQARLPDPYPGALVFMFGVNDAADIVGKGRRMEAKQSLETARHMIEQAQAWRPTLWLGPTPISEQAPKFPSAPGIVYEFFNDRVGELNMAFQGLADEMMVPYLDLFTLLSSESGWETSSLSDDRIHPAAGGYEKITSLVQTWPAWRFLFEQGVASA